MPRYFFHVSHKSSEPDAEGSELPDIHAAQVAAVRLCGEMIQEIDQTFWENPLWQLRVTDKDQRLLFTLTFCGEENAAPI
jgi:uncharacterized protein DUF6894